MLDSSSWLDSQNVQNEGKVQEGKNFGMFKYTRHGSVCETCAVCENSWSSSTVENILIRQIFRNGFLRQLKRRI